MLLVLWWDNSCYAGVEAESELESESIFSGRSRSRLKFVDSAALQSSTREKEILHWYSQG